MSNPKILAMVMAGGEGKRLYPLTCERSKPSVPFGGRYRIVDFVLSNLVNSQIFAIYLLVQYKSQSLIEHIRRSWGLAPIFPEQFVTIVPPQMREGPEWFQGTADAVYQNINLIHQHAPDLVAVFGADHIYRMDVRQMAQFHLENKADVTVAALPVPLAQASAFGVIESADDGRILRFHEKPDHPPSMPTDKARAYASMGNYLFSTDILYSALEEGKRRGEKDFGSHLLPRLCQTHRVFLITLQIIVCQGYGTTKNSLIGAMSVRSMLISSLIRIYWDWSRDSISSTPTGGSLRVNIKGLRPSSFMLKSKTASSVMAALSRGRVSTILSYVVRY